MGVLWMKIISLACINVVLINNNDYIFVQYFGNFLPKN